MHVEWKRSEEGMPQGILVINVGSTSVKLAIYRVGGTDVVDLVYRGQAEEMDSQIRFAMEDREGAPVKIDGLVGRHPLNPAEVVEFIIPWTESHLADFNIVALGHRVVTGGPTYNSPVEIDEKVMSDLESLEDIEPSHQSGEVDAIRSVARAHPALRQVAVFDTSYHRTMPPMAERYALPTAITGNLIRRWGFHGISFEYLSRVLPLYAPSARRVIVAHLGGGASMCAMLDGKSVDTSMGFSTLEGLPMSTRCGALDPGILLYLLKSRKLTAEDLESLLYRKSGLLGLSGISGDMRVLRKSSMPAATEAIDYFAYQIVKYAGAYAAVLGGLDAFVFTGGIGENDPMVRTAVVEKLAWLDMGLDGDANDRNGPRISTGDSKVSVWVIPTDEELMIAQHTAAMIGLRRG
jgi:acetate kinase